MAKAVKFSSFPGQRRIAALLGREAKPAIPVANGTVEPLTGARMFLESRGSHVMVTQMAEDTARVTVLYGGGRKSLDFDVEKQEALAIAQMLQKIFG